MTNFEMVREFTKKFKQPIPETPSFPAKDIIKLRIELIREEFQELKDAIKDNDIVEVADALVDIVYVTLGAAAAFGIDFDSCFNEIHDSNMSKLGKDGEPVYRKDGKVIKGEFYRPPNLRDIIFKD